MLVSNLGGMHLSNLTFQPFDFPEVLRTAARGFTLPPELPLSLIHIYSIFTFAFPLIIGMISGVYSTICIAGPLWVEWALHKKAKPRKKKA